MSRTYSMTPRPQLNNFSRDTVPLMLAGIGIPAHYSSFYIGGGVLSRDDTFII